MFNFPNLPKWVLTDKGQESMDEQIEVQKDKPVQRIETSLDDIDETRLKHFMEGVKNIKYDTTFDDRVKEFKDKAYCLSAKSNGDDNQMNIDIPDKIFKMILDKHKDDKDMQEQTMKKKNIPEWRKDIKSEHDFKKEFMKVVKFEAVSAVKKRNMDRLDQRLAEGKFPNLEKNQWQIRCDKAFIDNFFLKSKSFLNVCDSKGMRLNNDELVKKFGDEINICDNVKRQIENNKEEFPTNLKKDCSIDKDEANKTVRQVNENRKAKAKMKQESLGFHM